MAAQQFPKSYKDLPVINKSGAIQLLGSYHKFKVAAVFFIILCIYLFPIFHSYGDFYSPTYDIGIEQLQHFSVLTGWLDILLFIYWLAWLSAFIGCSVFVFLPRPDKRMGIWLGMTGIFSLLFWHCALYWYSWQSMLFSGIFEYWLLLFLFLVVAVMCGRRR